MSSSNSSIQFIHSYLVRPSDHANSTSPIGKIIPLSGDLFRILKIVFDKSNSECNIEVVFKNSTSGAQDNDVRDTLISILEESDEINRDSLALNLAKKLLEHTNNRTGSGLLFVIGGTENSNSKIMISRFPADEGIMAEVENGALTVEFVGQLFMKDKHSYKAVVFNRLSSTSKRRTGRAVDKQVNDIKNPSSKYWIEDFLSCALAVTDQAGSERFAGALRETFNEATNMAVKENLAAAATLLQNFDGQKHTPSEFLEHLKLGHEITQSVQKKLGLRAMTETFQLNSVYFKSSFKYRSKLLDTGVMITAEAENYDELVHEEEVDGQTNFTTQGKVVDSKIQKTRANGAM